MMRFGVTVPEVACIVDVVGFFYGPEGLFDVTIGVSIAAQT
jgi:hypothetical protein